MRRTDYRWIILTTGFAILFFNGGSRSALGLMLAPTQHEAMASYEVETRRAQTADIVRIFAELDVECRRRMQVDRVDPAETSAEYFAQMRYVGQSHQLEVPLGDGLGAGTIDAAQTTFHAQHEQTYNHSDEKAPVEFVALRAVHQRPAPQTQLLAPSEGGAGEVPVPDSRPVCLNAAEGYRDTPVYQRETLPFGFRFAGPAIVEQADTTTLIHPGQTAEVDRFANIVIELNAVQS